MNLEDIEAIQRALRDKGHDPGPIDGVWGRKTIAAVRAFQEAEGLEIDGVYGPQTASRLFPPKHPSTFGAPWMAEAVRLFGTRELPGKPSNPVILDMASGIDIPYTGDDIAWCGLFVGHCIAATLPQEALPGSLLAARSWVKLGKATTPRIGAVMVFWRVAKSSWQGHVGFYAGQHGSNYLILGGNQGDAVNYTWLHRDRLLEARWPATAISLEEGARMVEVGPDAAGAFSSKLS